MGIQGSKPIERRPSKSKSSLSEKNVNSDEITTFASQLNQLVTLNLENDVQKFNFEVFDRIPFKGKFNPMPVCSNITYSYDSVFVCYDCSDDSHAYLCEACFEKGNHEGHRFNVFLNNSGWNQLYCRCGDYEFMNKNTICKKHKQVKAMPTVFVDPKEKKQFSLYFQEIFKTIYSLLNKSRGAQSLLNALFAYLTKVTQNNLGYSKLLCQFLLQKNPVEGDKSNIRKLIEQTRITETSFFRHLSFAPEYKLDLLREMILGVNKNTDNIQYLSEMIINFSGKMDLLDQLAKNEDLIVGMGDKIDIEERKFKKFYEKIISNNFTINETWKCIIRNKLVPHFILHDKIMKKIINFLNEQKGKEKQTLLLSMLQQFLECEVEESKQYIVPVLMILSPNCFLLDKNSKEKAFDKKVESLMAKYYMRVFALVSTNNQYEEAFEKLFVLLPFFNFGQTAINNFWEQMNRRVDIFQKNKQKAIIKEGSLNYFTLLSKILVTFFSWEHIILLLANDNKLKSYSQDKKLIDRLLKQNFAKQKKILRLSMLRIVDNYTQKDRTLATESIKKYLRYNTRKGKYYYVGDKIDNNFLVFEDLKVGALLKLSDWQDFVAKKLFTDTVYKIVPKLIKIAQKGIMEDMNMVKTASNISIGLTLLNKNHKKKLKDTTREFIKQIPDVNEQVYYILASIRDRLELDMDDMEEDGMRGKKKAKLDVIAQIRDKKYRQMKEKQDNVLKEWLKKAEQQDLPEDEASQNLCHICKEKDSVKERFVFLANFTRNNVVSTLLKSQVTDLDINICLHKVHEKCYEKVQNNKRKCPLCKFDVNCYIPEKPLADESYTKNWLRNFENIVTNINLESGKSFNSDWATIFLTYLVFSRSFKVLLKSTEIQIKQRQKIDSLLMLHYRSQLEKWPELTKQAIKRAEKTVKGQVTRQSNIKKAVKSLSLDLVLQEITQEPFKNQKRIEKKIRELVNLVGLKNSQKITEGFEFCNNSETMKELLDQSINEESEQQELFKIRQFPKTTKAYLQTTSIKCPMCNKYQPTTWECLFCEKISCETCNRSNYHCERDHRGSCIFLFLNNAEYMLMHQNRQVEKDSLYRNEFSQGWTRDLKPEGWKCSTDEITNFFDTILHSLSIDRNKNTDNDSDDGRGNNFGGFGNNIGGFGGFGNSSSVGFGNPVPYWSQNQNNFVFPAVRSQPFDQLDDENNEEPQEEGQEYEEDEE